VVDRPFAVRNADAVLAPGASVPVAGQPARFPVHRIYCVGRNYEEHAKEMGFTGREPPFFFMKPADAVVPVDAGETGTMAYPSLTKNLHHEIELVVAIGTGGKNIKAADAHKHIYGYAVGLDMTRRDLQGEMKKQGRPWASARPSSSPRPSARSRRRRRPATSRTPRSGCR
jgi:fumarylpyruvate hydrolase